MARPWNSRRTSSGYIPQEDINKLHKQLSKINKEYRKDFNVHNALCMRKAMSLVDQSDDRTLLSRWEESFTHRIAREPVKKWGYTDKQSNKILQVLEYYPQALETLRIFVDL